MLVVIERSGVNEEGGRAGGRAGGRVLQHTVLRTKYILCIFALAGLIFIVYFVNNTYRTLSVDSTLVAKLKLHFRHLVFLFSRVVRFLSTHIARCITPTLYL